MYCVTATVLYGSSTVVPPDDGSRQEEQREQHQDLLHVIDVFKDTERLPALRDGMASAGSTKGAALVAAVNTPRAEGPFNQNRRRFRSYLKGCSKDR